MKHHLIYVIVDSSEKAFYVGKTVDLKKRAARHESRARTGCPLYLYNKLRKMMRENEPFRFDVVESDISDEDVDERERYWIAEYRKLGELCNLSDGGEGGKGMTPEMQKAAAEKRRGGKRSAETRRRMSEARIGIRFTEAHRKALSEARRKRKITDETKRRMSESSRGRINTKVFEVKDPSGNIHRTENGLAEFCRLNNLQRSLMSKVLKGERSHHKGWTANG